MKYSLKQVVVDSRGNRGQVVDFESLDGRNFYQVLFDKDWNTGKADFIPEENLFPVLKQQRFYHDDNPDWASDIDSLDSLSSITKIMR